MEQIHSKIIDVGITRAFSSPIQFTVQRETDGKLPFLDTCVQKITDRKLETVKYLSFHSHHPRSHKKFVVTTLFQRAAVSNFKSSKSALAEHVCETSHNIAWGDSRIITANNRY